MREVEKYLGFARRSIHSVMLLGGSRVAFYLAQLLEKRGLEVKIIEKDYKHCKYLAGLLNEAIVLNGDGSDIDLLQDEGVQDTDLFVALTEDDKLNILVSLMAKRLGASKTIAQVRRSDYLPLIEAVGIDIAISPRLLTAEAVLRFVRNSEFLSISVLEKGSAEVYEIILNARMKRMIQKPIKALGLPKGILIGAVFRDNDALIPSGDDVLMPGDRIIILRLPMWCERWNIFSDSRCRICGKAMWSSIGKLVMILGGSMLIPAAAGLYYGEQEYHIFLQMAVITFLAGLLLFLVKRPFQHRRNRLYLREGYAIVAYGWLIATVIAMLPYLGTGTFQTVTDAFLRPCPV